MRGAKTAKSFTRTQWWWEAARTKQSVRRMRRRNRSTASRGGVQILKQEEEDATPLARCEEEKQDWANWQCDTKVQDLEDKPWRSDEMKSFLGRSAEVDGERS